MKITIEHHGEQFNVSLTGSGEEPFLVVKGCRIVQGQNGPFVSWPSRKLDSGKYWQHVYVSRAFGDAVLSAYNKSKAAEAPPVRKAPPKAAPADFEDSIPF
jgi:DNA-binding cell septation regulator SpoVG